MKSMTGFGRADGASGTTRWDFEIRAVNGRGLDVRCRMPNGFDGLEAAIRQALQARMSRGSVTVGLRVDGGQRTPVIALNEAALQQVIEAARRVRELTGGPPATTEGLLGLRGVLEVVDPAETTAEQEARTAAMLATFEAALAHFIDNRAGEGERLAGLMNAHVTEIEKLVGKISTCAARQPDAIAVRLAQQIERLTGASTSFDPARLHQEAVLIATRADVEEELQRLTIHIAAARDLLAETAPVGRKFDFLTQEFNREANTLCSKASDPDISRMGLAIKVLVDQMREQVANVE